MNGPNIAIMEFISASTKGVVYLEFGFVPDFLILITDHGATNPNMYWWANGSRTLHAGWAEALTMITTGSSGIITRNDADDYILSYDGGETIEDAETANSDPKHMHRQAGSAPTHAAAGHITRAGVVIAGAPQTNAGRNLAIAFRGDM